MSQDGAADASPAASNDAATSGTGGPATSVGAAEDGITAACSSVAAPGDVAIAVTPTAGEAHRPELTSAPTATSAVHGEPDAATKAGAAGEDAAPHHTDAASTLEQHNGDVPLDAAGTPQWHALPTPEAVYAAADTTANGLTKPEAAARLAKYGPNTLTPPPARRIWSMAWEQFNTTVSYILLAAAVIAAAFNDWPDFGLILAVVILNTTIGTFQEAKAEKATRAIMRMTATSALVMRNQKRVNVPAATLVPGDLVFLTAGDRVPADVRWVVVDEVQITEAALTGESAPVSKSVTPVERDAPLADRTSMGYMGTMLFSGQGTAVVVATGDAAEVGKINKLMSGVAPLKTPLLVQVNKFGRNLSILCFMVAVGTFLIAYFGRDMGVRPALASAVGVAVALIPEGLQTVLSVTLALGVQHMARANAIIRQLPAVETLGASTVICSDKTGTLTKNEMTVVAVHTAAGPIRVTGTGYAPEGDLRMREEPMDGAARARMRQLLLCAALCNDSTLMPALSAQAQQLLISEPVTIPLPGQDANPSPPSGDASARKPGVGGDAVGATTSAAASGGPDASQPGDGQASPSSSEQPTSEGAATAAGAGAQHTAANASRGAEVALAVSMAMSGALRPVEWTITGDATEACLLTLAMKAGMNLKTLQSLQVRAHTECCSHRMIRVVDIASTVAFSTHGAATSYCWLLQALLISCRILHRICAVVAVFVAVRVPSPGDAAVLVRHEGDGDNARPARSRGSVDPHAAHAAGEGRA